MWEDKFGITVSSKALGEPEPGWENSDYGPYTVQLASTYFWS